jgi:hypothetical protein
VHVESELAFLHDPVHRPDARCIAAMMEPRFLVPRQGKINAQLLALL